MPRAHHYRPPSCVRPVVAGLTLLLTGLAACTPPRQPLPLDPDGGPPTSFEQPPRAVADETEPTEVEAGSRLIEEALLPEEPGALANAAPSPAATAAARTGVPATAASSASPRPDHWATAPSPLASLRPDTPPNVAAATRLTEAARLRLTAGDDAAALEELERAIAIDGGNPYAYFFLASLHLRHRTYDQAIAFAHRAASLSDPAAPEWASRAYALQGSAYESAGRFVDARAAYGRAVRAAPANAAAQAGLARLGGGTVP